MHRLLALGTCLALAACGRVGFDAIGGGGDDVGPPCTTYGPFGTPENLGAVNTASDDRGPTVSASELELYFDSNRPDGPGARDVWVSTRPDRSSAWGAPTPVAAVDGSMVDENPSIGGSGLRLIFDSGRASDDDLYEATRASTSSTFDNVAALDSINNVGVNELGPDLSDDGLTLYHAIVTVPASSNDTNLAVATRPTLGDAFVFVRELAELNSTGDDKQPSLSRDGRELFFETDRIGARGKIFVALANSSGFDLPTEVVELATPSQNLAPAISADGRTLYFASDRPGGVGGIDLWSATRGCQ